MKHIIKDHENKTVVEFESRMAFIEFCNNAGIQHQHTISSIHHPDYDPEADVVVTIDAEKAKWIREQLAEHGYAPKE